MKALILAAGLGTRLKPLTDRLPKALLKAGPYTLLEFAIRKLKSAGFNEMIINVHHFPVLIKSYLEENRNFGCKISFSDESGKLLDTGGGIKKASWFFDDGKAFLVYNVDIIGDLDLGKLYAHHLASGNMATLVLRRRETSRYLLFNKRMQLKAWENRVTGEKRMVQQTHEPLQSFAFSGIHVINPELFGLMQDEDRFSIIDTYLKVAATHPVGGFIDESPLWADAGKPDSLADAGRIAEYIKF